MKKLFSLVLALAMILSLAACGSSGSSDAGTTDAAAAETSGTEEAAPAAEGGKDTLTLAISAEPNHLNPKGIPEAADEQIMPNIMETLLTIDENGEVAPMLAESYEYTSDTEIIFNLRQGVKFHNGEEMTAEDVLYSLWLTSQGVIINGNVGDIDFDASEAVDDYTVRIVLSQPTQTVPYYLTWMTTSIVCKSAWEEMGEDAYAIAPIGTGPYEFVSWDAEGTITLKAFDDYWDQDNAAHIENLVFTTIEDANARAIAVETGTVDFAYYCSTADLPTLEATDGVAVVHGASLTQQDLLINGMNTDNEALQNADVRRALIQALDCDALVAAVYDGYGSADHSLLVSDLVAGYDPSFTDEYYAYDPENAKALLAGAGYADGFSFDFLVYDDTTVVTLAEAMRNMWAEVGIDCEIEVVEMGSFMNYFDASEFEVCYNFISITTFDPDDMFYMMLRGGHNNNFDDPDLNELIDAQHYEPDAATRMEIVSQLQQVAAEKSYIVNLFNVDDIFVYDDSLAGFPDVNRILLHDLAGVYWTE